MTVASINIKSLFFTSISSFTNFDGTLPGKSVLIGSSLNSPDDSSNDRVNKPPIRPSERESPVFFFGLLLCASFSNDEELSTSPLVKDFFTSRLLLKGSVLFCSRLPESGDDHVRGLFCSRLPEFGADRAPLFFATPAYLTILSHASHAKPIP